MNDTVSKNRWDYEGPGGQRQRKQSAMDSGFCTEKLNVEGMAVFLKKVAFTAGRKETLLLSQD